MRRSIACVLLLLAGTACARAQASATQCARPDGATLRAPILLYHHIGDPVGSYPALYVPSDIFRDQIEAIARSGAASVTMTELADAVCERRSYPKGVVALTFDDGTEDQREAFDIMREYGVHATFYIATGRIGKPGYLTWDDLEEMHASGLVDVENHTVAHADLVRIDPVGARAELVGASRAILEHLGSRARQFAYPYGHVNAAVEALVRAAGFATAVTTEGKMSRSGADALRWGRIEVHGSNVPSDLAALAAGSGTWSR